MTVDRFKKSSDLVAHLRSQPLRWPNCQLSQHRHPSHQRKTVVKTFVSPIQATWRQSLRSAHPQSSPHLGAALFEEFDSFPMGPGSGMLTLSPSCGGCVLVICRWPKTTDLLIWNPKASEGFRGLLPLRRGPDLAKNPSLLDSECSAPI